MAENMYDLDKLLELRARESNQKFYKYCFVPKCKNTSVSTPHKLFLRSPKDVEQRKKWSDAASRDPPMGVKSVFHCCEDHFDLPNDLKSYIQLALSGGQIKMKPYVVPYKFDCQIVPMDVIAEAEKVLSMQIFPSKFSDRVNNENLDLPKNKRIKKEPVSESENEDIESQICFEAYPVIQPSECSVNIQHFSQTADANDSIDANDFLKVELKIKQEPDSECDEKDEAECFNYFQPKIKCEPDTTEYDDKGPTKRRKFEAGFKLKVIEEAKNSNNCAAARKFGVTEKMVREWRKKEDVLIEVPKKQCSMRRGITRWPELENEIEKWILEQRHNCYIVTRNVIRVHALKWARSNPEQSQHFKASAGWFTRFMNRKNLTVRQKTKISQKLPEDLAHKVIHFQQFVIRQRQRHQFPLSHIGNMDETPMNFDMIGNRTDESRGAKTVQVKSTGDNKNRFTVVLSCMADGTKLMPMVIFKRKTMPKIKFSPHVFVHVHEKGWMDENGIKLWIKNVWNRRPGGLRKEKSLLVWDMFRSHLTDNTRNLLGEINTEMAVIPGGLTSILQPLDVSLNKPFKDYVRAEWNSWVMNGDKSFTTGGAMRSPSLNVVCDFVSRSWNKVKTETVVNSFKKCSISNAIDGTEDNILWDTDNETDFPDSDADDPHEDCVSSENQRLLEALFSSDEEESEFEGF